jgi:hypothetical protein
MPPPHHHHKSNLKKHKHSRQNLLLNCVEGLKPQNRYDIILTHSRNETKLPCPPPPSSSLVRTQLPYLAESFTSTRQKAWYYRRCWTRAKPCAEAGGGSSCLPSRRATALLPSSPPQPFRLSLAPSPPAGNSPLLSTPVPSLPLLRLQRRAARGQIWRRCRSCWRGSSQLVA